MIPTSLRSLNMLCIIGYLAFMSLAIDSSVVDALVFYVSETDGQPILTTGNVQSTPVPGRKAGKSQMVALQYRSVPASSAPDLVPSSPSGGSRNPLPDRIALVPGLPNPSPVTNTLEMEVLPASESTSASPEKSEEIALIEHSGQADTFTAPAPDPKAKDDAGEDEHEGEDDGHATEAPDHGKDASGGICPAPAPIAKTPVSPVQKVQPAVPVPVPPRIAAPAPAATPTRPTVAAVAPMESSENPSILAILKALPERAWTYNPLLDRFVVRYDAETTIVLTIRPTLQNLLEKVFSAYSCKLGAGIIQDPTTGAVLAMTSYDGWRPLAPTAPEFKSHNWALQPTFPVASLFKIITASAGLEKRKVVPASSIKLGRRWSMTLWEAFAKSHNGVFGIVGRSVGQAVLQSYANAFGFNRPFYFDLPVANSVAAVPAGSVKLGESAAGLNRNFEISPIHVASIISTVLNRGRQMKPYLVDYVMRGNKVIFRRKPFPVSQPISAWAATQIYEMMKTTTTHGTGKRGFGKFPDCPELGRLCGGKTGTLTGASPHYLITWFGGFTRTAGRDLSIVFMVGQPGQSSTRAATLAGRMAYELYASNRQGQTKMALR